MKISTLAYVLIITTLLVILLIYGKTILLPIALAIMVWTLIRNVKAFVGKASFLKRAPNWLLNLIAFCIIFSLLGGVGNLLTYNIKLMSASIPKYEQNITIMAGKIEALTGYDLIQKFDEFTGDYEFTGLLRSIFNVVTELFSDAFMVVLYVVFLMLEEAFIGKKLRALFNSDAEYENAQNIINRLDVSVQNYLSLKTLVSVTTGFLSYVALAIIGVDYAVFWAFLIFLLNFIPTIGSIVATFFPASMALLQTASFTPFLLVLGTVGFIQVLIGNVLEPKIMGKSLNISALVVLIALSFWGSIWGITGMVISVPVTVILIILFAQFPKTKKIAILLSENGSV